MIFSPLEIGKKTFLGGFKAGDQDLGSGLPTPALKH